jgi:hypothetical protein
MDPDADPGGPKHTDPTDPENWCLHWCNMLDPDRIRNMASETCFYRTMVLRIDLVFSS